MCGCVSTVTSTAVGRQARLPNSLSQRLPAGSEESHSGMLDRFGNAFTSVTPMSWATPSHALAGGTASHAPFPNSLSNTNRDTGTNSNSGSKNASGSNSNSGGARSGSMPSKPSGLGGWASVAGHNDEIQSVATGDRKDIDRYAELYAAGGGVSALNKRNSSQDGQRLMQWCDVRSCLQSGCIFLRVSTHAKVRIDWVW